MNPDIAMSYLDFVVERHRIWERRQAGAPWPWTKDPILLTRKFTNVYRVLDYGSQFLVRELLDPNLSPRDTLARCFLYRYTNLPATWLWLRDRWDDYPREQDLHEGLVKEIQTYRNAGNKVFSGAYVILPQPNREGDKVEQAVILAADFMTNHADHFLEATSQDERFRVLRREYGVGPFLAMQILTDYGYSVHANYDQENEFVVPGPGCIKGAAFIEPGTDARLMIEWCSRAVDNLPDCPLLPVEDVLDNEERLRSPSLMDIQNTLCEFSKYHRFAAKPIPEKAYETQHNGMTPPVLPAHW